MPNRKTQLPPPLAAVKEIARTAPGVWERLLKDEEDNENED